jgi:hypothetical protein
VNRRERRARSATKGFPKHKSEFIGADDGKTQLDLLISADFKVNPIDVLVYLPYEHALFATDTDEE